MNRVLPFLVLLIAGAATAGNHFTIPFAVFSYDYNPAEPREDYLAGDLGIVIPSYARSYLYVAHRWMDGVRLTTEEQQGIQRIWFGIPGTPENYRSAWADLRSAAGVPGPDVAKHATLDVPALNTRDYVQFFPCTPHAFKRAADRLREHLDRLLAATGEREQARTVLDRLLPEISTRISSWNRALELRSQLGRTAKETLWYGLRHPASFGTVDSFITRSAPWEWSEWDEENFSRLLPRGALLMPRTADILDSAVPLARFAEVAEQATELPNAIRRDLIIAAWVRAVLLDEQQQAAALAVKVAEMVPETEADMVRFRGTELGERRFVAVGIMLKFPGMSARVYPGIGRHAPLNEMHRVGLNWWWWTDQGEIEPRPPTAREVDWLTPVERTLAKQEWDRIVALGNGAAWLYQTVTDTCVRGSPPSGCAEVLYRAAVSSRWIDYNHGIQYLPYDIENAARYEGVESLKRRFPNTRWARLVESDQAAGAAAWKHDIYSFRLSAPYPH